MDVYCPMCETRCPEEATKCRRCGHPLGVRREGGQVRMVMFSVAAGMMIAMVVGTWCYTGLWDNGSTDGRTPRTIEEKVREAYRSLLAPEDLWAEVRYNDPIEVGFKSTVRVADILGEDKEEWLRWGFQWATGEYAKPTDSRGYYIMPVEYVYSLTDDPQLADAALHAWREMCASEGWCPGEIPRIVRYLNDDGEEKLTWDNTICWDEEEAKEFNAKFPDEEVFVKKRFPGFGECWCSPNIVGVKYTKRRSGD